MTRKLSIKTWDTIRELTQGLYQRENLTLSQLTSHLQACGYHVNQRMMKRKVIEWGWRKKLQEEDVLAAIELLIPYRHLYGLDDVSFYIWNRLVDGHELILYLNRRGIIDPFEWVQHHRRKDHGPSLHVTLGPPLEDLKTSSPSMLHPTPEPQTNSGNDAAGSSFDSTSLRDGLFVSESQFPDNLHVDSSLLSSGLTYYTPNNPDQHQFILDSVVYAQIVVRQYLHSRPADAGTEPTWHAGTVHGRFGDRMQHGLFRLMRQDYVSAAASFNEGCLLLRDFLYQGDPVSLALVLVTLCEMCTSGHEDAVRQVLLYAVSIVHDDPRAPRSLSCLLRAILKAPSMAFCTLQALQAISTTQSTEDDSKWRDLYIRERLCDGLYFCEDRGSSASKRLQLLIDQESFYVDRNRRNVLYTLTNVADNYLTSGEFVRAEQGFAAAYQRAECLSGYALAKIQFAALEGISRTRLARAENLIHQAHRNHHDPFLQKQKIREHLEFGLSRATSALDTAIRWFDSGSRRTTRVEELQHQIQVKLTFEQAELPIPLSGFAGV